MFERFRAAAWHIFRDVLQPVGFDRFMTGKKIIIKDRRLAALYNVSSLGVWCYVLWNLFVSKQFLESALPLGSTTHWVGTSQPADMTFNAQGKRGNGNVVVASGYSDAVGKMLTWIESNNNSFGYCGNSDYNFEYSSAWTYGPYTCKSKPSSKMWFKSSDELFFELSQERSNRRSFVPSAGVASDADCKKAFSIAGLICLNDGAYYSWPERRCVCSETSYEFNIGLEHLSVEFYHSYTSAYAEKVASGTWSRPRTIVRLSDCVETSEGSCDLMEINKGDALSFPLQTLLSLMRVDLDGDACDQDGGTEDNKVNNICPKVRVTGMTISAALSYYNFAQQSSAFSVSEGEPVAILKLRPTLTWTSRGNDISDHPEPSWRNANGVSEAEESTNQYRYGIKVIFTASSGSIGRFDVYTTINILVQGFVLINMANFCTAMVAKHLLGYTSYTYKSAINEKLSFNRELGRFALHSLLASELFKQIDADRSGSLDVEELFDKLAEVLKFTLEPHEIRACTQAVFDLMEAHVAHGESERGAQLPDFIDFLSDDRVTLKTLRAMTRTKAGSVTSNVVMRLGSVMYANTVRQSHKVHKVEDLESAEFESVNSIQPRSLGA
eukprot:TRINITY_DN26040_c0_g1_i1.p1 TRINITY_DN26040_c0_g1~~TRINITY_DN26040_c0_g1_i1.p1  ORF type:complete len:610 (+),score=37.32 TRINITY_DN26040_c0_g1_i1:99-1928(+)